jgi:hypothetical protein
MHSDDFESTDDSDTREHERQRQAASFGHRHGLKVLGAVLASMFALVIVAQVAC